jgi:hypothetical protein
VSDEYVSEMDREIGQVTKYSDMEQYPGNFSNVYKKGTKYYSIVGISTDEAIAVQDGFGEYKKAVREEKYTFVGNVENLSADSLKEEKANFSNINASLLVLFSIFLFCFVYVIKKKRS